MNSGFYQDPLQEFTRAVRKATPSVDEQLLASEAVTIRAEQIAKELREDLPPPVLPEDEEMLHELKYFTEESKARIRAGQEELLRLQQSAHTTVDKEERIVGQEIPAHRRTSISIEFGTHSLRVSPVEPLYTRCFEPSLLPSN